MCDERDNVVLEHGCNYEENEHFEHESHNHALTNDLKVELIRLDRLPLPLFVKATRQLMIHCKAIIVSTEQDIVGCRGRKE